eukprot:scaffold51858_cov63-Phaeocystis_antarctica.AAC.1
MAGKRAFARTRNSSTPRVWPSLSLAQTMHLHKRHLHASKLRPQYNELVLAADMVNSLLPSAIEAVYMRPCETMVTCRSKGQSFSRGAHASALVMGYEPTPTFEPDGAAAAAARAGSSNLVAPFRLAAA